MYSKLLKRILFGQVPTLFGALEDILHPYSFSKYQVKSWSCLSFDNHLEWVRYFPSSWIFAQLPPRRATLFYFIQDDGKHVTKSRMESPKFIILSSLPDTLTLVQLGIESWKKSALKLKQIRPPCFDVWSLTAGWKVGKSRHHSDGALQWQAE